MGRNDSWPGAQGLARGRLSGALSAFRGGYLAQRRLRGLVSAGMGAFVPMVYLGGPLSGGTVISIVVQNFSEIGQSAAEL